MPRWGIELDDVEGHMPYYRGGEDLTGQEVTVRMEDGTEVQGHVYRIKYEDTKAEDAEGLGLRIKFEDTRGDDTEGHAARYGGIDLEVDDTAGNMLRAATDRGEPIYVRFPDGAEVQGHRWREDQTGEDAEGRRFQREDSSGEDVEGHRKRFFEDTTGEDVEGHRIVTPPQSDIP